MNLSFRALSSSLVVALVGLQLSLQSAQHTPLPPQPKPGGTYTGPGDTVPPCVPPGCQPQPQICSGPCTSNYGTGYGCSSACFGTPQAENWASIYWLDENGYSIPPECMQVAGTYRVYQITIRNLLDAATAASGSTYPRSNLCFFDDCPSGVDSLFVYTTPPFQSHPQGVQTASGGYMQVCGMTYGFKLLNDNGTCIDLGGRDSQLVNETSVALQCTTTLARMSLQFDVSCLAPILNFYGALGLYNPAPQANTFFNETTVVFVVIVKCCAPGGPTCD